ncbi:MAG TPA: hypothetical protein VME66_11490 [Candidatus Acidoferrales bacterium]|nr:hypothetical protein [Candidatus Acidoferrales bacterium]
MSELTFTRIDGDDKAALSALADVWHRAYNSNGPRALLSSAEASAEVFACAETSLWRLAGTYEGRFVSMAFGVQVRENDGAGAPIAAHVLLRCVAVDAPFCNRGFGRETVSALLSLAGSNVRARHLCERLGFRTSGRTKLDERGELISHLTASLAATDVPHALRNAGGL